MSRRDKRSFNLFEYLLFIVINLVFFQKILVFVNHILIFMELFLIINVLDDGGEIAFSIRKRPVSFLPGEPSIRQFVFIDSFGRASFDIFHQI